IRRTDMATISASFAWEPGRNTFGTSSLQRRLSTTLDALDLMLHPKQGVARDTRTTEVLYGGAAETTVPAIRSGVRCQHNARSANLRGCRADGNDNLDFHPRRRARRWHETSAPAHDVVGAAAHEGRRGRARQQDRKNGMGHDRQGRTLQGTRRTGGVSEIASATRRDVKVGRANST